MSRRWTVAAGLRSVPEGLRSVAAGVSPAALLLLLFTGCQGALEDGADAYARGDVATARATWEEVAASGLPSGALLYDLGNARFREGDLPRAIAAWRGARLVRPRDGRISHNLALARSRLDGVPQPVGAEVLWREVATPGEVGLLALLLLAVASGGAVWRRWLLHRGQPDRPSAVALPWLASLVAGAVVGGVALHGWYVTAAHPVAVVVDAPAVARDAPRADGTERYTFAPGSELRVDREYGPFVLVRSDDDRRGWVPASAVEVVAP